MINRVLLIAAGLAVAMTTLAGGGQVVIDMPAPPRTVPAAEGVNVSPPPAPRVGDVALWRYAEARSSPWRTYPRWGGPLPPARYVGYYPYGGGYRPYTYGVYPYGYAYGYWPYHTGFPFILHGFHFGHRR